MIIVEIIQITACVVLMAAAIYWRLNRSVEQGVHRFLLPYILVASAMGIAVIAPFAMEMFVAYYSGAIYSFEPLTYRFSGPYWWYFYSALIFPLLPIFGVFPQIGNRPVVVAFIGMLAMAPVLFNRIMSLL